MRHRAFTLVELLVAIAVLALLTALWCVVLGGSRQRARTVACGANIRHLTLSLVQYDSAEGSLPYGFDFDRKGPPPGGYVGSASRHLPGWWWFHYTSLVRYRSRKPLEPLLCPSKRLDNPELERDPLVGNFGVNRSLCKSAFASKGCEEPFTGTPLSLGRLSHPGSTLLIVDSGYILTYWWHATAEPPVAFSGDDIHDTAYIPGLEINQGRILWPGQSHDAIGGRHPNKTVNVGFADGHADTKRASELLVTKTEGGGYTNTILWQGQ